MDREFVETYISSKRFNSYDNNQDKYLENLKLSTEIYPLLNIFEISFRNKIVKVLKDDGKFVGCNCKLDKNGLETDSIEELVIEKQEHEKISKASLGKWIMFFKYLIAQDETFVYRVFKNSGYIQKRVRKYYINNIPGKKYSRDMWIKLALISLVSIRNRAFHHENLLKLRRDRNGNIVPRISSYDKESRVVFNIEPSNIKIFVKDMIKALDDNILENYES